ncbi:MAG TPA: hypothetical protein ENI17_11040 [Pseudomonas xinjiangensis]|uniref:Single-strand binding protein family protein n=2 Tax=root TaxID=1 RepID=A0A7V1BLE2_9GAMM|nr:hypothetical protein [Halopseudomonas xinjiangensis]HEC48146.1 hypothetical protein [Halopseudomonas xinjiangensis]
MLTATITGGITSKLTTDEFGRRYCTIYSDEARRAVRAMFRNARHAELVGMLPKGGRLTVSGRLGSKGAISLTGKTVAHLTIDVQTMQIHFKEASE